jgi:hypothetical protein
VLNTKVGLASEMSFSLLPSSFGIVRAVAGREALLVGAP